MDETNRKSPALPSIIPSKIVNITLDAKNMPTGMYFCRLQAGTYTMTKRMMLVK